jgi:putative ABC transport system permease protein
MWLICFRDLSWRRRRFAIAVFATALVFAITLLMSGIKQHFHNEVARTVKSMDADAWVVPAGTFGPFTSTNLFPASAARRIAALPGVTRADPLVLFRETVEVPNARDLNVIGYTLGGIGTPAVAHGRDVQKSGEIVVDSSLGVHVGETLKVLRRSFRVVGTTHGITYLGGTPTAFLSVRDAQQMLLQGARLATAVGVRGTPRAPLPSGLVSRTNAQVRTDLGRPLKQAVGTIGVITVLLWLIAAGIIAAILYMSALERVREFAVMKATGAANSFVMSGLALQAITLSVAAAIVAIVLARLLVPAVPIAVEIPSAAYVELVVVSLTVGVLGSAAGLRRMLSVDPAAAFGGA